MGSGHMTRQRRWPVNLEKFVEKQEQAFDLRDLLEKAEASIELVSALGLADEDKAAVLEELEVVASNLRMHLSAVEQDKESYR